MSSAENLEHDTVQDEPLEVSDTEASEKKEKRQLFPKWAKPVLIIFGVIGLVWAASTIFGQRTSNPVDTSGLRPTSIRELESVGTGTSDEYRRMVEAHGAEQAEVAASSGRSYVAPITGRPVLESERRPEAPPASLPTTPQTAEVTPPSSREMRTPARQQEGPRGDQRMVAYLSALGARLDGTPQSSVVVLNRPAPKIIRNDSPSGLLQAADLTIPPGIREGDILYSINRVTLDSTSPGPAMVEIIDGPYAGGKAIGQFVRQNEWLTLEFSTLSMPNGARYSIRGFAIDPRTDRTAVRSAINNHTLERWGGLFAAKFIEGWGQARSASGTSGFSGMYGGGYSIPRYDWRDELLIAGGKVGQAAGRIFERNFDKPPTVTLTSGTEIGILIVSVGRAENEPNANVRAVLQQQQQPTLQRQ
jgi:hypothetical protein